MWTDFQKHYPLNEDTKQKTFQDSRYFEALKYVLQSRLTTCPMAFSLGRTKYLIMSDDFEFSSARK